MRYISFLSETVKEDAKRHSLINELEKLATKIETEQTDDMFQPYEPTLFRKKPFGKTFRLICYEKSIGDCSVYCFLRILVRGETDYNKFIQDNNILLKYIPTDEELNAYIEKKDGVIPKLKPPLSDSENSFLYDSYTDIFSNNIVILESEDWVNLIISKDYEDQRVEFYNSIKTFLNNPGLLNDKFIINSPEDPDIKIICRFFENEKHLYLIAPLHKKNVHKVDFYLENYKEILDKNYNFDREDLLRKSVKAYPEIIAYEKDTWLTIQKNNEGNLALSPEEEEILKNINSNNQEIPKYPLFINGRAGSGKSTILMYLYSDILLKYIKNRNKDIDNLHTPIFITYSDILLKNVKDYTKKLFECNSQKIADENDKIPEADLILLLNRSFKKFEDFILELLGNDYRVRFRKDMFIDFSVFKKLYKNYAEKNPDYHIRRLSPEICWHIIRTYIKGMRDTENNFLDIEEYIDLPKNFKTVSTNTYELVYNKIWNNWYQKEYIENGYWDSQDITRALLDSDNTELANYPAIFCDEAQDFTRNELELIFKLSFFSNRDVNSNYLKFIPFAFAGDPFQTLNPTGFDWNSIKANFHDKIVKPLDKFGQNNLEFNFNELLYNYRSSKGIVLFNNLIQLLRGVLFKIKDLRPQKSWQKSDVVLPEFYKISDDKIYSILKEESEKGIVFIIPAQEGGAEDYIKGDNLLLSISKISEDFNGNLITPIMAKGLEFNRVVVYKFGQEYLDRENFNFLDKMNEEKIDSEEYLPYQYFINNLYVACSRAKKRLFIVDTEDGIKKFWEKIRDLSDELILNYSDMSSTDEWNEDSICEIIEGKNIDNIKQDPDNPFDIAEKFYELGISNKDIAQLRLARQNYNLAGNQEKAKLCTANIFELEKEFKKAAEKYLELGEKESAIKCYWEGKNYVDLIEVSNEDDPRNVASRFLQNELNANALLSSIIQSFQIDEFKRKFLDKYFIDDKWHDIFLKMIEDLSNNVNTDPSINLTICRRVEKIIEIDKRLENTKEFSDLLFNANEFQKAISIWDSLNLNSSERYFKAKETIIDYPEKIEWQFKLKKLDEILNYYKNSKKNLESFDNNQRDILINSFINKEPDYLINLLDSVEDYSTLKINKDTMFNVYDELIRRNLYAMYFKLYTISDEETIKLNFEEIKSNKVSNLKDIVTVIGYIDYNLKANLLYPALNTTSYHIRGNEIISNVGKLELYKMITNAIQRQKFDPNDSDFRQLQLKIVDLINQLSKNPYYLNHLGIEVLGASLERSGYIVPTLEFFESIIKESGYEKYSEKQRDFAKERWVKTKERQGKSSNNTFYSDKANEMFRAYQLNKKFKSILEIPDFPIVDDFKIDTDKIFDLEETKIKESTPKVILSQPINRDIEVESMPMTFRKNEKQNSLIKFNELFEVTINNDLIFKIINKKSNGISMLDLKKRNLISDIKNKKFNNADTVVWDLKDWKVWITLEKTKGKGLKISFDNIDNIVFEHIF